MSEDDEDYINLSLSKRLTHKLWKARLHGYQELQRIFQKSSVITFDDDLTKYWKQPELFVEYITYSNVVAHEQAVAALLCLLEFIVQFPNPPRSDILRNLWIPPLVEKGLGSSRQSTKVKSQDCIMILASMDKSIEGSITLMLPYLSNKLPRLISNVLHGISGLIEAFGFINVNVNVFLPILLESLPKLASHADKSVRANTLNLILQIYKWLDKPLLEILLLDKLKPIHQRDLIKLFDQHVENIPPSIQPRLFQWQKEVKNSDDDYSVDKDGDTLMGQDLNITNNTKLLNTDPFDLLPASSILDKLPDDFQLRITSSKWKDRVEVLQEIYDQVFLSVKKLDCKEDYSDFIRYLATVISKDANMQAVELASTLIYQLATKLRTAFSRYGGLVLIPLLERTKEKKPSVNESISKSLDEVSKFYGFDNCLEPTLEFMKNKIPQIRIESTKFLTRLITTCWSPKSSLKNELLFKLLPTEVMPSILKIVNDSQPSIRNAGFNCIATLMKLIGERELSESLDKLESLKKKKIYELYEGLDIKPINQSLSYHNKPISSKSSVTPQLRKPNITSTIPSKRGPSSPLRMEGTHVNNSGASLLKPRLTTRSLTSEPASISTHNNHEIIKELEQLRSQKDKWLKERQELLGKLQSTQLQTSQLNNENSMLQNQLNNLQTSLHEKVMELRSKDLQLTKLKDRLKTLETKQESHNQNQTYTRIETPSKNMISGINTRLSLPSSHLHSSNLNDKFSPLRTKIRSPSESSDDLPRRVNSLQLGDKNSSVLVNDESWKRAAEVTSQLKARIERMRAKTRGMTTE